MRGTLNFQPSIFFVLGVLLLTLIGMFWPARLLLQDLRFTAATTEVSYWGRGEYEPLPAVVERAKAQIEQLLLAYPGHPEYLELQANTLAWLAYWSDDPEQRHQYLHDAVTAQFLALESRPAYPQSWVKLIDYNARADGDDKVEVQAQQYLAALQRWVAPSPQVN